MKLTTLIVVIAVFAVLSVIVLIARRQETPAASNPRLNRPLVATSTVEQT